MQKYEFPKIMAEKSKALDKKTFLNYCPKLSTVLTFGNDSIPLYLRRLKLKTLTLQILKKYYSVGKVQILPNIWQHVSIFMPYLWPKVQEHNSAERLYCLSNLIL